VVLEERVRATEGARLEDSVLLAGATVGPGARVVRSVIGPEALVAPGAELVDVLACAEPDPRREPPESVRRERELWIRDLSGEEAA
jgi:ADP-glucose pyrophosphorylase